MTKVQPGLVPANGSLDILFGTEGSGEKSEVLVWWGLALVERVPRQASALETKLSAARYYNMGCRPAALVTHYGFARTTLRRYGSALKSGDPERVARAFGGQGGPRKIGPDAEYYIRGRYVALRFSARNYRARIREEVEKRWSMKISGEALRRLFRDEDRVQGWGRRSGSGADSCAPMADPCPDDEPSRNRSLPDGIMPFSGREVHPGSQFVHHAGLALLYPWLEQMLVGWADNPSLVRQLFAQVLCGSVNHEQTKTMHLESLGLLCGPTLRTPWYLCRLTDRVATPRNTAELFHRNLGLLCEPSSDHYLFDPHLHRYSGILSLLDGYLGSEHCTGKAVVMDFIHTPDGRPCLVLLGDSFQDARYRFHVAREVFAELLGECPPGGLNWVVDRGLFGLDCLAKVVEDGQGIVTWEKGYERDGWDRAAPFDTIVLTRVRNHSDDLHTLRLDCQVGAWSRDERFERVIVNARRQDEREALDVAVLAAGTALRGVSAAGWMFSRWPQESNLGYLLRHMGIGQMTSRAWDPYARVADTVEDRQTESREHRDLLREKRQTEAKMGKKLVARNRRERAGTPDLEEVEKEREKLNAKREALVARYDAMKAEGPISDLAWLEEMVADTASVKDGAAGLDRRLKRATKMAEISADIDQLAVRMEALERDIAEAPRTESRLEQVIAADHVRLETSRKAFMDAIRIACCNIFFAAMDQFRRLYDNRRDDHEILRALTRAPGLVAYRGGVIHITLVPELSVQPKAFKAMRRLCAEITDIVNRTWTGRASPVVIAVTRNLPANAVGPPRRGP